MSTNRRTDPAAERLTGWIQPVVDAAGYDLEELVVTPAGRRTVVRVVVDRDEGVSLDDRLDPAGQLGGGGIGPAAGGHGLPPS